MSHVAADDAAAPVDLSSCPANECCLPEGDLFTCVADVSGEEGQAGAERPR